MAGVVTYGAGKTCGKGLGLMLLVWKWASKAPVRPTVERSKCF
jgi:hypothetical protein